MKKVSLFVLLLIFFLTMPVMVFAQKNDSLPTILKTLKFDGVIKTKLETSAHDGDMRFYVRNARFGARGDIGEFFSYRMQVDFVGSDGQFQALDFFATFKPTKNLSLLFGQQNTPFDNSYMTSPGEFMFANNAFVGDYLTPGSRDMGLVAQYKFRISGFPMEGQAGMFNGGRINDAQWTDKPSYVFRMIAGSMTGFRSTAKVYRYNNENMERDWLLWGADLRYASSCLRVETEIMNRHSYDDKSDLLGGYIQSDYMFYMRNYNAMFRTISPAARIDLMGYDVWNSGFDVTKCTAGLKFGLTFIPFDTLLRIDYEHYFMRKDFDFSMISNRPHIADHKFTVEVVVKF